MEYLTTKQAAERLNYKGDAQIRKLIERKQIKNAKKLGPIWLIPEEELENLKRFKNQKKKKTP